MAESVLITGAAGYLGSILVPEMLARGYEVTALDTYARNDTALAAMCSNPNFNPIQGDARDKDLIKKLVAKSDILLPFAGLVGAPLCNKDPFNARTTNLDAVVMLNSFVSKDQRIIYPTTNSGYGIGEKGRLLHRENPSQSDFTLWHHKGRI